MKFAIVFFILSFSLFAHGYDELCPTVKVKRLKKLKLTDNERRLLCGDKETSAYKSIPTYEAKYFFQGFLQSRGYLKPSLTIEDAILLVDPGKVAKVGKIHLSTDNHKVKKEVQSELRRLYKRKTLSTGTLSAIEGEGIAELRNRGYPCAKVSSVADVDYHDVILTPDNLSFHRFGEVDREPIEGLRENALDRFYPFEATDAFQGDLLKLTEKRLLRSEVVQGTYFLEECKGDSFTLKQNFILGPPRTLRYGVGASTELGPMARLRWSHNRYKSMASQLSATAQGSLRTQSLTLSADTFFWHGQPRRSVFSEAEVLRERQLKYEQLVYRSRSVMKWTRDSEDFFKLYTLGPAYEGGTYHSNENSNTRSFSSGILTGGLQWMSHDYELFDILPQDGELYSFNLDLRHPTLGFGVPLLKLDGTMVHISRLANWGRGTIIGASRLTGGTSWLDPEKASLASLPPTVKFYGGGSDDIRGFYLRTLPKNGGAGALTKATAKLELRRTYLFIPSLEAFAFLDGGYFSEESWTLDSSLYYSPGAGLRWLSPLGMVQSYVARGLSTDPAQDGGNFYYIGIGGTF